MDKDERTWDDIKDRDPHDPLTQLEIMREKAEQEGCGVSHQYNVIRRALSEQQQEIEDQYAQIDYWIGECNKARYSLIKLVDVYRSGA